MSTSIIIDVGVIYTRAAILENGKLVNLFLENNLEKQTQGAIYQGAISNILKNIKAAFLDIGQPKTAFLHYEDIPEHLKGRLQNNQRMMVQVMKEGVGNKGPKVTAFINIPGKFMVLLPYEKTIGISRKILDETKKAKLKSLILKHNPKGYGLIVRTDALEATDDQLVLELEELIQKWEVINTKGHGAAKATILYEEPSLAMKVIREHAKEDTLEIVINDEAEGKAIREFLKEHLKEHLDKLRIVEPLSNLYGAYGIDKEIERTFKKQIWLKSGANIVIEKTEAMNIIDVNSAKFVTTKQKDKMILKVNLEAAKESARQIRFRNLSGIIIIDFIDMQIKDHKDKVMQILEEELSKDKTKFRIYPMTELGLVQITRQRKYNSLHEQIMQPCSCCGSHYGHISFDYLMTNIEKEIRNIVRESIHRKLQIISEEGLIKYIKSIPNRQEILENKYNIKLKLTVAHQKKKTQYDINILN